MAQKIFSARKSSRRNLTVRRRCQGASANGRSDAGPLARSQRLSGWTKVGCHHGHMRNEQKPTTRAERLWAAADARGIPLRAILATIAVASAAYLAAKLAYRLRDVVLLLVVAGFISLLFHPVVAAFQRWRIRRP